MHGEDLALLVCPACRGGLSPEGGAIPGPLTAGALACHGCGERWPVRDGLPHLYRDRDVRGNDRLLRAIYDGLPWLHDPLTTTLFPVLQGTTEARTRERLMAHVELPALRARADRPVRILEVGIGAGANLPLIHRLVPPGLAFELWGLDLSLGMLEQCRSLVARQGWRAVRLLAADAHALPFPDRAFDRVFHVGGIGGYRDPRTALAEMARVAEPGSPIVVVDEQLDPSRRHGLVHRAFFRALTFYDPDPHCPREHLPGGATDIVEEQISRFYYCLTFRMPRDAAPTKAATRT